MPDQSSSRISISAAALLVLVAGLMLAPLGAFIADVVARTTGGNLPPQLLVAVDPVSDAVSATGAEFRVDEAGAATYSIPLYTVPGTAGVTPQLTLSYSSQGGYGALGKGWSIGGLSTISRCRATREAGDFLAAATPDGNPRPVNFTGTDRFCLDGQRLVPASVSCPSAGGLSGVALATEVDAFRRICAYTANATVGPAFFTVEGKDGSISWYGDRNSNSGGTNRPDGYVDTTSLLQPGAAITWAQTRFQDSSGNYIDYLYNENPAGAGTGEHHLREVRYTGRVALSGQSTGALAPYAKLQFNYVTRPSAQWTRGYVAGGVITGTQRLESITACASAGSTCPTSDQVRHVLLTYGTTLSGSGLDTLIGLQECRDSTAAVCSAATAFVWSAGANQFATLEKPAALPITTAYFKNFKLGDLNGDGRQDFVYLRDGNVNCSTSWLVSMLSTLDGAGIPTFTSSSQVCLPANIVNRGDGAWHLFDYNGDGRDDLFVSAGNGQPWRLHPSNGTGFDLGQNLLANLAGSIPSLEDANSQVQLADLNGDGLTDIVYPAGGVMRARLMERQGGGFGFGAERTVAIDEASLGEIAGDCNNGMTICTRTIGGMPTPKTGFAQLADFNGDAASDLLIRVTTRVERNLAGTPGCDVIPMVTTSMTQADTNAGSNWKVYPYAASAPGGTAAITTSAINDPCWEIIDSDTLHAFVVQELGATLVGVSNFGIVAAGNPTSISLADINGDGLTDVQLSYGGDWMYRLNTGLGFLPGVATQLQGYYEQARFVDVTGDGRADIAYVMDLGSYKAYGVRPALPGGGFGSGSLLAGANARICEGSGCNVQQHVPLFADLDGDGNLDFMSLSMASSSPTLLVSRSNQRFVPRDVITKVVNGLGLETDLTYAPMTNAAVYRRDTGSRNGLNWGRGSPVMDMLLPNYLVARAASTSPIPGNPAAKATVHYRYAGARAQAGGRGFLGFREIVSIDPNQSGGHVVTTTRYAQNFPFIGVPVQTIKSAVLGQAYIAPSCLNGILSNSCFATPGQPHPDLGGSWFSNHVQSWEMAPASLASQTPLHVRTMGTEESLRDPYTGAQTSKVATAFAYGSHGNVTQTVVDTYTGASTLTATLITSNSYSDDTAKWRLGRLTASTVTHRRAGQPDVVRTTGFSYAMGGAGTGLLTEERIQPGGAADLASATAYVLDDFGNRVQSITCAAPATGCSVSGFQFHPASPTTVKRYSRVEYDASGRFPVATYEPFWSDGGGAERRTSYVVQRNAFGDPVEALDVNNVRTLSVKGALGRDYYTWAQTTPHASPGDGGATSLTTYRWCGTGANAEACPTGAKFRQQVAASAAPRQWTYFDALGRPVMKAIESFNAGVINQDVSAVCTEYDTVGRVVRTSNPFFLAGTGGTQGPTNVSGACGADRQWTATSYDILGRPTVVQTPDGSQVTSSYAGLTTTTRDARNNPTVQTRNGKGEIVTTQDAAGFPIQFGYNAAGNLTSVSRNAGAGTITNTFVYDVLGRKVQQTDPDNGTTTFAYNALGELMTQTDNGGYRIEHDIDARGRVWRTSSKLPNDTIESQSTLTFDTAANGAGQPAQETTLGQYAAWSGQAGTELDYQRHLHYDALGRLFNTATTIDGETYTTAVDYDALGRPWKAQDASGVWSKTQYGSRGAVAVCASDGSDSNPTCASGADTYQRTLATDAWGNVVREIRGNSAAMEVRRQYHALTGRLTEICAGNTACNLVKEAYVWDAAGNLASHQKEGRYLESFTYDSLNRVTEGRLTMANGVAVNQALLANAYDALGNVCSKNGLGYAYPGADGCVGAVPMAQAASIPLLSTSALPAYQQRTTQPRVRPAWNRGQLFAPENGYRRYSDDEDRPSWEHDAEEWTLGSAQPTGERFWVRSQSRQAAGPTTTAPTRTASSISALTQPLVSMAAVSSVANSPHAVNQTGTGTAATFYYYDDRGNQTLRDASGTATDRTIRYSADSKAHDIQMGNGQRVRFWYGPDGQRYKREEAGKVTLYVGGVEVLIQNGVQTARRYVAGVALQTVMSGVVQTTKYLFHDHLGSLVRIANTDGSLAEALDYTTFGDRRAYGNPSGTGSASTNTPRGFTGHEYVDGTQVIHMNGRIYDQQLGRFLQPDPVIQEPANAQSWNAYTYVFNNPLAYTDPTGNISFRQALGIVIVVVGTIFAPQFSSVWAKIGYAMVIGFASGYVATGTLRGGVTGAFTAGITMGIGQLGLDIWGQMAFQSMTGGIIEGINGGKFGHGFMAAGLTTAFMPQVGTIQSDVGRTTMGALVGGTISSATGGKFANGAISGAIQGAMAKKVSARAFNDANGSKAPNPKLAKETLSAVEEAMFRDQAFRSYDTELDAHNGFAKAVRSVSPKAEVGVKIGFKGGKYYLGAPFSIGAPGSVTGLSEYGHLPKSTRLVAISHSHPGGPAYLSGTGAAYAYNAFDTDNTAYQSWNRVGDGMSAYNEGINVYSFSETDYDYFNYENYRALQKEMGGQVPICFATRLGCP